jgi:uncharacterized protein GlcG (DUF336 family)
MKISVTLLSLILSLCLVSGVNADKHGMFTTQSLTPETALKAATTALEKCRSDGYQVAVAVVDRMGNMQVMIRDRYAGAHTSDTARRKAWTATSFRTNTSDLLDISAPGKPQAGLRDITEALVLGGGVLIEAGGSLVGAIGVSGAPGGELDDICAVAGIDAIEEDIAF